MHTCVYLMDKNIIERDICFFDPKSPMDAQGLITDYGYTSCNLWPHVNVILDIAMHQLNVQGELCQFSCI